MDIGKIFILDGIPSSGKTTLCDFLECYVPEVVVMREKFSQDLLEKCNANPELYSQQFQMDVQSRTVQRYETAAQIVKEGINVIIDRSVNGNHAFAEMAHSKDYIDDDTLERIQKMRKYAISYIEAKDIDLVNVFLHVSISNCLKRLKQRSRPGEEKYDACYIAEIGKRHLAVKDCANIIINTNNPVEMMQSMLELVTLMKSS